MRRLLILALAALLVASCAPHPGTSDLPPNAIVLSWDRERPDPLLGRDTPADSVTVRWTNSLTTKDQVAALADRNCLAWDRHAEMAADNVEGQTHVTRFTCKKPAIP
jgi:hypothetical protein